MLCAAALAVAPRLLDPQAAASLIAGRAHQEHGFVPPALVDDLRRSLVTLGRSEMLRPAESFSSNGQEDDLRSALTAKPNMDDDSMYALYERLDDLREQLQLMLGRPLSFKQRVEGAVLVAPQLAALASRLTLPGPGCATQLGRATEPLCGCVRLGRSRRACTPRPGIEASYVVYPTGGYYRRHIDAVEGIDPQGSGRRCVSFICYLNAPGSWLGGKSRPFPHAVRGAAVRGAPALAGACRAVGRPFEMRAACGGRHVCAVATPPTQAAGRRVTVELCVSTASRRAPREIESSPRARPRGSSRR